MRRIILAVLLGVLGPVAQAREWNVLEAGATADGTGDNTAVFQKLLDTAGAAGGGIVRVPTGRYRINGNLAIPGGVVLKGTFVAPPTNRHDPQPNYVGSVLLAYAGRGEPQGDPFIRLNGNMATLEGFIIQYPEWRQSDVPPVPYPPCILSQGYDNVAVLNCCLINPYEGIRLLRAGRHLIRNVYGYPIQRGLYVDECYDIGRVENCHFWPFGVNYRADEPYAQWVNLNGVAFEFARTDWQYVLNTFCFGYGVGYLFSRSDAGACNGNFLGIGADSCVNAVRVDAGQPPGLLITNGEFVGRWMSEDSIPVLIGPTATDTKVSLTNCSFWGPIDQCVRLESPTAQFTANACNFLHWDNGRNGSAAVELVAGRAIIQGNTFGEGDLCVRVGAAVNNAIVMANQAPSGLRVENQAGERLILFGNEQDRVVWTHVAKVHYIIDVGSPGDSAYLRRFHGPEAEPARFGMRSTARWSSPRSLLVLPVQEDTDYAVTLELMVPAQALSTEAGLYYGDQRIARFTPAARQVTGRFETGPDSQVTLEVRSGGWIPSEADQNSQDRRELGIRLYSVEVKAENAGTRAFNANTGGIILP